MAKRKCDKETLVYSRVVGFMTPVQNWNKGKKEEFKDRKMYDLTKSKTNCEASGLK